DGTIEAAEGCDGDAAPDGSGSLTLARGIEMGHIFQLRRRYADALGLQALDSYVWLITATRGSYGVGVSRAGAAIVEGSHDELGIVWPREVAPYDVHLVATGKDEHVYQTAERMYHELLEEGVPTLFDDRPKTSPGVKFKDAELLGMPTIATTGTPLADGVVEVRERASGHRRDVPVDEVVTHVAAL